MGDSNAVFPPASATLAYAGDGAPGTLALGRFARGSNDAATLATVRGFNFLQPGLTIQGQAGVTGGVEIYAFSSAVTAIDTAHRQAGDLLEAIGAMAQRHVGASGVAALRAGRVLSVTGALGGSYLLTSVRHVALRNAQGDGFSYGNEFSAIPLSTPFRPMRSTPIPNVGGTLSAVVTGPAGSTVYRDQHGRLKVQFRFDRDGAFNEHSSAWVRAQCAARADGRGVCTTHWQ